MKNLLFRLSLLIILAKSFNFYWAIIYYFMNNVCEGKRSK